MDGEMGEGKSNNDNAAAKKMNEADQPSPHRHSPPSFHERGERKKQRIGITLPPPFAPVPRASPPLNPQMRCVPKTKQKEIECA